LSSRRLHFVDRRSRFRCFQTQIRRFRHRNTYIVHGNTHCTSPVLEAGTTITVCVQFYNIDFPPPFFLLTVWSELRNSAHWTFLDLHHALSKQKKKYTILIATSANSNVVSPFLPRIWQILGDVTRSIGSFRASLPQSETKGGHLENNLQSVIPTYHMPSLP
jgi:hypothetical protein